MIQTSLGYLDGGSWERLIQSVFKRKYEQYQEMVSSPGDFGVEGFVLDKGVFIQCYCPEKEYDTNTLYEKQRDKITEDLNKLKTYSSEILKRVGESKFKTWIFITPTVSKNEILSHVRKKEKMVRDFGLPFIDEDFIVLVHDIDTYLSEIREIQVAGGRKISFSNNNYHTIKDPVLTTEYDDNIESKNRVRSVINQIYNEETHQRLNELTKRQYLKGYEILKGIHIQAPEVYSRILKIINQFEDEVEEESSTWQGTPQELISCMKEKLNSRFDRDQQLAKVEYEDLHAITTHMVARWIAECPMRINS
ncbi:hypothetical protein L1077_24405 [Pseudoalteromonas luteoviolacea]|uniref:hypothetical protein n=1 Tax=Pseudoalteromonas luteoviolacea TaxID=43657 RepID=UPI001F2D81BB|nr:hypothetical protein [Pseudoalteromonas luteoviolacea]MCF6442567.1 hypothetical protein [Pseudoalteromonas luteoviolacea]